MTRKAERLAKFAGKGKIQTTSFCIDTESFGSKPSDALVNLDHQLMKAFALSWMRSCCRGTVLDDSMITLVDPLGVISQGSFVLNALALASGIDRSAIEVVSDAGWLVRARSGIGALERCIPVGVKQRLGGRAEKAVAQTSPT